MMGRYTQKTGSKIPRTVQLISTVVEP